MKILLILFVLNNISFAFRLHPESWYQENVATKWKAQTEVKVANGRVDIVGKNYATEVEFADKWKEAIGQALWYAMQTNKQPGIVIICETPEDNIHAIRLRSVINNSKLDIKVWIYSEIMSQK